MALQDTSTTTEIPRSLGERLSPLLHGGFFRPLSRPTAAVYIDCAERLIEAADEGGQVAPEDALALIRDVLATHPAVEFADDEGASFSDLRQRAGQIYNRMLEAGWLQSRQVSLDERWVLLSPPMRPLLRVLRELAQDDLAELKDFAATVRSICETLLADGALDPRRRQPEELRQVVKELGDRLGRAGDQMHAVERLILQQEERQRTSGSGAETLQRFLVEFHEGEHMVCYDALEKAGLLPKLKQARLVVQDAIADPFTKQQLAEGLAARRPHDPTSAYAEAERMLTALEAGLTGIVAKQRIVDGRIADFSRLSAARYRYQTELRGRRPEQVKAFMQAADAEHVGASFADLASLPGMGLLSPEIEIHFGRESLSRPRKTRLPVDLSLGTPTDPGDVLDAQDLIRERTRDAVTPQRGSRLVERLLPEKGARVTTADFHLNSDDFFDLLAVLAFERGPGSQAHRQVRWRVHSARCEHGLTPDKIEHDPQGENVVERVEIERLT